MSQAAAKAGMPQYVKGAGDQRVVVCAAKIKELLPIEAIPNAVKATFDDFGKEMNLGGPWLRDNPVQVGGYLVIPEGGGAAFMHAQQFEREFQPNG